MKRRSVEILAWEHGYDLLKTTPLERANHRSSYQTPPRWKLTFFKNGLAQSEPKKFVTLADVADYLTVDCELGAY
jgi:hypothetical protein